MNYMIAGKSNIRNSALKSTLPILILFILILANNFAAPTLSMAEDRPFNNMANWGGTGLMEIPTARVLDDGVFRVGYAQALPYRWFTISMGIFPGLETSFRYTEITNIGTIWPEYGANKDKCLDLKYQIVPESKKWPAITVGLNDIQGTQLFEAQYLAINRQIYPFDFTLGYGTKRLEGLFGGVEWIPIKKLHVLAEYNPIKYEDDKRSVRGVPEGADAPVNLGLRYEIFPGFDLGASYQRGDTFGFTGDIKVKLGKPLIPKQPDPPKWVPEDRRPFAQRNPHDILTAVKKELEGIGFKDVQVYTDGKTLAAEFENTKYISNQQAAGRALRVLLYRSPADTETITAILKRRQIPFLKISVDPVHLDDCLMGKISEDALLELTKIETIERNEVGAAKAPFATPKRHAFNYQYGIKPNFQAFLNDSLGPFKFRVGIKPFLETRLWQGGSFYTRYDIPFYSNIESGSMVLPDAVRSDSWKYLGDYPTFERLMVDQTLKLLPKTYARISAGYLEYMYAGAGGELLTFFGGGNLALGVEGDWVRKREPDTQLALLDLTTHTILANAYYTYRPFGLTLNAKYGRFMAGDIGWRFQLTRTYDNGLEIGAWYSITDTSELSYFNKDYNDKGVFMRLPARMFSNYETNVKYGYSFSPWSRDVAQTVSHWKSLFDQADDLMPAEFKDKFGKIKK